MRMGEGKNETGARGGMTCVWTLFSCYWEFRDGAFDFGTVPLVMWVKEPGRNSW